jgi:hypothetical protein
MMSMMLHTLPSSVAKCGALLQQARLLHQDCVATWGSCTAMLMLLRIEIAMLMPLFVWLLQLTVAWL